MLIPRLRPHCHFVSKQTNKEKICMAKICLAPQRENGVNYSESVLTMSGCTFWKNGHAFLRISYCPPPVLLIWVSNGNRAIIILIQIKGDSSPFKTTTAGYLSVIPSRWGLQINPAGNAEKPLGFTIAVVSQYGICPACHGAITSFFPPVLD